MRFTQEQLINTFNKNVNFLSKNYPQLLEKLNVPQGSIRVNLDHEGRLDALVGSVMVYGGDAYKKSLEQVQRFINFPIRLLPNIPIDISYNMDYISHRTTAKIHELIGGTCRYPQYPPENVISLLVVVGLGFGFHLNLLRKHYKIQHIILIDMPIFAHLSLYTMNWQELIQEYNKPDKSITLYIGDDFFDPQKIDSSISDFVKSINRIGPMLAYWGYYYEHLLYNPPVRFLEWLAKTPAIPQLYKGFFDDELWSLDWSLEKLSSKIPAYYGGFKLPQKTVAFVLGAGPSLDKAIELIRKYQDRAIIFSSGSTITALERAGIIPDYHVEIERTKYTYDILSEVNKEFLEKIELIANNPLWTECFNLFKKGYMFLKLNDTGAIVFASAGVPVSIWHTGPTVTAASTSVAAELGFEEIYLFGVDLGSKSPREHHSKQTNYYKEGSILAKNPPSLDIQYPAKNGGMVYTNIWFIETAKSIEAVIRKYPVKVYNASDGIKIEGAIDISLEDIDFENIQPIDKAYIKSIISQNFRADYINYIDTKLLFRDLIKNLDEYIKLVKDYADKDYSSITNLLSNFTIFNFYFKRIDNLLFHLIFHDTHMWTTLIVGEAMVLSEKKRVELLKAFWKIYKEYLYEVKRELLNIKTKHEV